MKFMQHILSIVPIDQGCQSKNIRRRGGTYTRQENYTSGLNRWFSENWTNQRGETGYKYKSDIYRPNIKITKDTPTTFKELKEKEIEKARQENIKKEE